MSILVHFPEVIFLFKVNYKCWLAIGEHSVYMKASDSEIVILLLAQKHALSRFHSPRSYIVIKEDCLTKYPKECCYFYILS